ATVLRDLAVGPGSGIGVHPPTNAARCFVDGCDVASILERQRRVETGDPRADDHDARRCSRERLTWAAQRPGGHSSAGFQEISASRPAAPAYGRALDLVNRTPGSFGFSEIAVQLLQCAQQRCACHGTFLPQSGRADSLLNGLRIVLRSEGRISRTPMALDIF